MDNERFSRAIKSIGHNRRTQDYLTNAYAHFSSMPSGEQSRIIEIFGEAAETLNAAGYPIQAEPRQYLHDVFLARRACP